ncbi:MAG: hypothetical protein M1818_008394 [Claussenomyces sp. TS43310]|nr:MAG: hypothetical protein M1818_008394 [Claussenomyces sp. TS43310]
MDQQQQQQGAGQATTQQGTSNNSQEDYGDKGLDFVEKKSGHTMNRNTNEKITDGARGLFEKATG